MSRFADNGTPSQGENVLALLAMLSNPDELKKRLENLQAREKELDEKIALAGEASQILVMRENVALLQEEANKTLEIAKAQAQSIVKKAQEDVEKCLKQGEAYHQSLMKECADIKTKAHEDVANKQQAFEEEKNTALKDLVKEKTILEAKASELTLFEQELKKRQKELDKKSEQLTEREKAQNNQIVSNENFAKELLVWQDELKNFLINLHKELANITRIP